jgi:hypothetical protein
MKDVSAVHDKPERLTVADDLIDRARVAAAQVTKKSLLQIAVAVVILMFPMNTGEKYKCLSILAL